MKRKILVTHSLHRQKGYFPFPPNMINISWDGIPQALSIYYDVEYIPIRDIDDSGMIKDYDIILLWQDDIFNDLYPVWDFVENKLVMLMQTGWLWKTVEMNCVNRKLIYNRLQKVDIVYGVVNEDYVNYFCRKETIISDIVNSIEFEYLYKEFYKKIQPDYSSNIGVMPHMIEPHEDCNWSKHLLSMKILNRLGYRVGYQSRVYKEENKAFTQHLTEFGIDCLHIPFIEIYDYIRFLSTCSIMFELHDYSACSMGIIAALFGHLPSFGSPSWYQKKLFPDLIIDTLNFAKIKEIDENLRSESFRKTTLEKGIDLARKLDHKVIGGQLQEIIETKWHQLH